VATANSSTNTLAESTNATIETNSLKAPLPGSNGVSALIAAFYLRPVAAAGSKLSGLWSSLDDFIL